MKKLVVSLLALGAVACQPQHSSSATKAPTRLVQANLLPRSDLTPVEPPQLPVRYTQLTKAITAPQQVTDSLVVRQFFKQHDLSALLRQPGIGKYAQAMDGFRGITKYRTEVAVLQVHRSHSNPAVYSLQGLTRTRRRIKGFRGQLTFTVLNEEPLLTAEEKQTIEDFAMVARISNTDNEPIKRYSLVGRVALTEAKNQPDASDFVGSLVLEVARTKSGKLVENAPFLRGPSQGGGQKYEGIWTTRQTSRAEPAVWVTNLVGYSPHIFDDLIVGERDVAINPKYAKLGWNTYWQNDEWWADSPKPKLNL